MRPARTGWYIAALGAVALLLSSKGIGDESVVSLQGDMPRYMMNGVYLYDLLREAPFDDILNFTYRYYARYPALSMGHHPLLPGMALVPFYALFGVSVASARLATITFILMAAMGWFLLVRSLYDRRIALLSSLLFVSSPIVVQLSRVVMSEPPSLAFAILSGYFFLRFCETDTTKHGLASALCFVLSCYSKQTAIFLLPVFIVYLVSRRGLRVLKEPRVMVLGALVGLLLVPLIVMSLAFSRTNLGFVVGQPTLKKFALWRLLAHVEAIWSNQLSMPVAVLSAVGIIGALARRERRSTFFLLWIVSVFGLVVFLGMRIPRYSIYWVPALCLFAAWSVEIPRSKLFKGALICTVAAMAAYQTVTGYLADPEYARGYEDAAQYVIDHPKGPTVMYNAAVDSGYFVFFVRKRDPSEELVVLRSDKVLATSRLGDIVEERISKREEIYEVLRELGTCYVALEDMPYTSPPLEWLREEVKGDRFRERVRIPIQSRAPRLRDVDLAIYEYKECGRPDPNAVLDFDLPLAGKSLRLKLANVIR